MQATKLEKRIAAAKDAIFQAFSAAVGVASMREAEAQMARDETRRGEITRQVAEVEAEEARLARTLQELLVKKATWEKDHAVRGLPVPICVVVCPISVCEATGSCSVAADMTGFEHGWLCRVQGAAACTERHHTADRITGYTAMRAIQA